MDKRNGKYTAVPLSAAHTALTDRWNGSYKAISDPPAQKQLPLSSLLPGGEDDLLKVCSLLHFSVSQGGGAQTLNCHDRSDSTSATKKDFLISLGQIFFQEQMLLTDAFFFVGRHK